MEGKGILVVGCTGSGKSTFVRGLISKVNPGALMLYDVNAEYLDLYARPLLEFDDFAFKATRVSNAVIVYEEATIFLDSRSSNENLVNVLIKKRHKHNTIIMVFHSLSDVPLYIWRKSTHLVLFKTNDSEQIVSDRFKNPKLLTTFTDLQNLDWIDSGKKDNAGQTIYYSPSKFFDIYNVQKGD